MACETGKRCRKQHEPMEKIEKVEKGERKKTLQSVSNVSRLMKGSPYRPLRARAGDNTHRHDGREIAE